VPDLPLVVLAGIAGEETAVEAMRFGAHDFVVDARRDA
jgi:FixJ family two-component response regulator